MVLFVDNVCVEECPQSTTSFFIRYPVLVSQAEKWTREPPTPVPQQGTLYVAQREFAVVPGSDDRVSVIGSEDATTCHIVLLKHSESAGVALAHFDGGNNEEYALEIMVRSLVGQSNIKTVDVYSIGGFYGENGVVKGFKESQKLSVKLLKLMMKHKCEFHIIQWCCCELNTLLTKENLVRPIFHGLCWDRTNHLAHPATFEGHGPDSTLRSAAAYATGSSLMTNLYDHLNKSITILPFDNDTFHDWDYYSRQPNDWILRHWSTSPSAEPPHFCDQMRKLFTLLATHSKPKETLFCNSQPTVYVLERNGDWKKT